MLYDTTSTRYVKTYIIRYQSSLASQRLNFSLIIPISMINILTSWRDANHWSYWLLWWLIQYPWLRSRSSLPLHPTDYMVSLSPAGPDNIQQNIVIISYHLQELFINNIALAVYSYWTAQRFLRTLHHQNAWSLPWFAEGSTYSRRFVIRTKNADCKFLCFLLWISTSFFYEI